MNLDMNGSWVGSGDGTNRNSDFSILANVI
jgi:hypothetical protein